MATALSPITPAPRLRSTPYARRLARDRGFALASIAGSGPGGRVTGQDIDNHVPTPEPVPLPTPVELPVTMAASVAFVQASALAVSVDFEALEMLLAQIGAVRSDLGREEACIKAAALAIEYDLADQAVSGILLSAGSSRRTLSGAAQASLGAIARMRDSAPEGRMGGLALSFLSRSGVRPVAAQLVPGVPMRLTVGAGEASEADCLLSYDPARVSDDKAANFMATFRHLIETPLQLLV